MKIIIRRPQSGISYYRCSECYLFFKPYIFTYRKLWTCDSCLRWYIKFRIVGFFKALWYNWFCKVIKGEEIVMFGFGPIA